MAIMKSLNKQITVKDGKAVVVETTESQLSRDELIQQKVGLLNRQKQINRQITELKNQIAAFDVAIAELDNTIAEIDKQNAE
jgi:hypothetical protein